MADPIDDVLSLAKTLARAIAAHARFVNLRSAENEVFANSEAKGLAEEFQRARQAIRDKEKDLVPIEPEEKRALSSLHERVRAHPMLQELSRAQADYAEMMDKVNRTIAGELTASLQQKDAPAPSGDGSS